MDNFSSDQPDIQTPLPWDDQNNQLPPNFMVKFMCSYGGTINPRPHDNNLSYVGGDTKILAVQRSIKFHPFLARLRTLCQGYVSFKYQLPGEHLDSLISVTNDDDLQHMMHEYDLLYKASSKPARLRLFLFPDDPASTDDQIQNYGVPDDNVTTDHLEKGGLLPPHPPPADEPLISVPAPDHLIQRQINYDLQRLHVAAQQQQQQQHPDYNQKKTEVDNIAGEFYAQNSAPEKATLPINNPISMNLQSAAPYPAGYWQGRHVVASTGGVYQPFPATGPEQSLYMINQPMPTGNMYQAAPMIRQVANSPVGQGFYLHRINPYGRDQALPYGVVSTVPPGDGPSASTALPTRGAAYSEGLAYRPTVYYSASPGGVMLPTPPPSPYQAANEDKPRVTGELGGNVVAP